jgi:hypothetical protein
MGSGILDLGGQIQVPTILPTVDPSASLEEIENILSLPGIEPQFLYQAHSLVTIRTELRIN